MNRVTIKKEIWSYEMTEEMNTLRTNIQFAGKDKQVIMVTSCTAGEGKSSTAMHLAISLSQLGKKVMLIDADMRKSVMVRVLESSEVKKGLSHYLSDQCTLGDVVCATNMPLLHMVLAGPVPPKPTELLSSDLLVSTMESFRRLYDYIIVDTAPLGLVVDGAIIGKISDASILLIESGSIKYRFAQGVKEKLENCGCPILGVVLNKVDRAKTGSYYGSKYKKYYGK